MLTGIRSRPLHFWRAVVQRGARLVAPAARRLQEPSRDDSEHHPSGQQREGLAPTEVLDVVQQPVSVRLDEVAPDALDAVRGLFGKPGRRLLALLAQFLADAAQVRAGRADLLARLRGA